MAALHLNLDVPSGVLIVGSHLHAVTSVGHGFRLDTPESLSDYSRACAQEGLIEIFMPDLPWYLLRSSSGELMFKDAEAALPKGHQRLIRLFAETHLGLMDGDHYRRCAQGKRADEQGQVLAEVAVPPGRYSFTFDYTDPLFFAEKPRRRYVFARGQPQPYAAAGRPN